MSEDDQREPEEPTELTLRSFFVARVSLRAVLPDPRCAAELAEPNARSPATGSTTTSPACRHPYLALAEA
jgi:hypothetical protein